MTEGCVFAEISMSLDGFIAGPNRTLERPLGEGGERLHEWAFALRSFRERHGLAGGEANRDDELVEESLRNTGATMMGQRMFSGGEGAWERDPNADGWWGDDPPFRHSVFILTHHPRQSVIKQGGTTFSFVTDGIERALEQAREAAGDKDISVAGGAQTIRQYLQAGLLHELRIHLVPLLLGDGVRLFEPIGTEQPLLEKTAVIDSGRVTHLHFGVRR